LFDAEWKEPFRLGNGWLLWGGVGVVATSIGVALAGAALTALNGEPPRREVFIQFWFLRSISGMIFL